MKFDRLKFVFTMIAILGSGVAAIVLVLSAIHHELPRLSGFDREVQAAVHGWSSPLLTASMLALTGIGSIFDFSCALLFTMAWLIGQKRVHPAALLGAAMAGGLILNDTLKLHFKRLRPGVPWAIGHEPTFSFPSGHSLLSAVLYGTLAYLALRPPTTPACKAAVLLPAILLPLGIGLSRIYLGLHFPTDVLAGWTAGLLWLGTILAADQFWQRRGRDGATAD